MNRYRRYYLATAALLSPEELEEARALSHPNFRTIEGRRDAHAMGISSLFLRQADPAPSQLFKAMNLGLDAIYRALEKPLRRESDIRENRSGVDLMTLPVVARPECQPLNL